MPDKPLVSIAIPVYNQAEYVAASVESVLSQNYPNVELIVLDDGSTDATCEVLARYADRCRVESHSNVGQAATLNRGGDERGATSFRISQLTTRSPRRR